MSGSEISGPGWYHAEGDPPNTQRYWDGEQWHGEPMPAMAPASPAAPPAPGFAQAPGYYEKSQATTALVLSILGILICAILAPFGWRMGQAELDAIDAGRRDPSNRGTAQAAKIVGLIATVLLALGILIVIIVLVAAAASAS